MAAETKMWHTQTQSLKQPFRCFDLLFIGLFTFCVWKLICVFVFLALSIHSLCLRASYGRTPILDLKCGCERVVLLCKGQELLSEQDNDDDIFLRGASRVVEGRLKNTWQLLLPSKQFAQCWWWSWSRCSTLASQSMSLWVICDLRVITQVLKKTDDDWALKRMAEEGWIDCWQWSFACTQVYRSPPQGFTQCSA